jgi:hypothetical protein
VAGNYTSGGSLNSSLVALLSGIKLYDTATCAYDITATTSNTIIAYYSTDALAEAAICYESVNLGGYTILTTGLAVPETATYALFGGFGALGLVLVRRKKTL